jgi:RNA polymerase sigma-70 factor (ECF subfamily)
VRAAVLELPIRQRAVVVLHYLDDLPVSEVAAVLGCSEGTVKTHLHRARRSLATTLGEELDDDAR